MSPQVPGLKSQISSRSIYSAKARRRRDAKAQRRKADLDVKSSAQIQGKRDLTTVKARIPLPNLLCPCASAFLRFRALAAKRPLRLEPET
jgi:hypothetical protein